MQHGCTDITASINLNKISSTAVASGGLGDVWRAALTHGMLVAIKTIRMHILVEGGNRSMKVIELLGLARTFIYSSYISQRAAREVYSWSKLQHPNVQLLLGIIIFQGKLGMVSPWMEQGHLQRYIAVHPNVERYSLVRFAHYTFFLCSVACSAFSWLRAYPTFIALRWYVSLLNEIFRMCLTNRF